MTSVYVDVGAASVESAATPAGAPPPDLEAIRALHHLSEAGVHVYVIAPGDVAPSDELREVAEDVLPAVPERPDAPAFYLTSDIERCQGSSARLRTVLIGGVPPAGSVRRCDGVARDVQAAALEILAADAMPPVRA